MNCNSGFYRLVNDFGDALLSDQVVLVNFRYRYVGSPDRVSLFRNKYTLTELKTVSKPKNPCWISDDLPQLSAYWLTLESLFELEQAVLIYYWDSNDSWQEFPFTPKKMEVYKQQWIAKLNLFRQLELMGFDYDRLKPFSF